MTLTVPTVEPRQAYIGEAWAWDATYADHPADESWTLDYFLRGAKDLDLTDGTEVNAASSGPTFEIRVPKTTTDDLAGYPGRYRLTGRVTKSGDNFDGRIVYNGHILILADPSTAVGATSFNRQMLAAIRTAMIDGATSGTGVQRVTVNGRTVEYRTADDLIKLESTFLMRVAIEENPDGSVVDEIEFVRP